MICTNVGMYGLLNLAGELISYSESKGGPNSKELTPEEIMLEIKDDLQSILDYLASSTDDQVEEKLKVPFGSGGPKRYFFRLCEIINDQLPDFCPAGFTDWLQGESTEQQELGDRRVKNIRGLLVAYIFDKFRATYGEEKNAYFERGISDKDTKRKAFNQAQDVDFEERAPLENYLDILDYKKIIETKANWPIFKDVLSIPLQGQNPKAKDTSWLAIFNDARKNFEHSTFVRTPKPEDFVFLEWLERELYQRFQTAAHSGDQTAEQALAKIPQDLGD